MSEEKKGPIAKLRWFSDLVENVPRAKDDSATGRMIDLESARLVRRAGEVALDDLGDGKKGGSIERGVARGLEGAAAQTITDRLVGKDPIREKVDEAIGEFVSAAIKDKLGGSSGGSSAEKELAEIKEKERLTSMFGEFQEQVVKPLAEQVQNLAAKIEETKGSKGALTAEDAVEMVMNAQEKAKELLKKQGYSVESVQVSKEDVKKMIGEEQTKFDAKLTEEKAKWEQESGTQVQIETERVRATENILSGVMDRVFDVFLEPLKGKIQEAIEKGAFARAPTPGA